MFVNRQAELELLEQRYTSEQAELFVLYGRRRVGKTELLTRFCQGKRHVFFVADLDVEPVLRAGLSAAPHAIASNAASGLPRAPRCSAVCMLCMLNTCSSCIDARRGAGFYP